MENKIQKSANTLKNKNQRTMKDYVTTMESAIKMALPSVITPERFSRMVLSALSTNPKLNECTPQSFLGAMMTAAQLGVEPNTPLGQSYLIPYRNKGTMECQFQLGYKGLIDLAYRSGEVELVQAQIVYENDKFDVAFGLNPKLEHIPSDGERGEPIKVYALFKTKSGGFGFEVMTVEEVKKHAQKYSQAYSSSYSPWKTNFEEMAKKTVLKKCLKYAPLKSDFVKAVVQDETIKKFDSDTTDMYEVPSEDMIDVESDNTVTVDETTGEVIDNA